MIVFIIIQSFSVFLISLYGAPLGQRASYFNRAGEIVCAIVVPYLILHTYQKMCDLSWKSEVDNRKNYNYYCIITGPANEVTAISPFPFYLLAQRTLVV